MFNKQIRGNIGATSVETISGSLILTLLVLIAVLVYFQQFRYDPALFNIQLGQPAQIQASPKKGGGEASLTDGLTPPGFKAMGNAETFDKTTLSDKIDGKADLYLESGFVSMTCQRFSNAIKPDLWYELFVYDMGAPLNAFSVYSNQRRADGRDSTASLIAYTTPNALFLAQGLYYIEAVASQTDASLSSGMENAAHEFIRKNAAAQTEHSAIALLPEEGLLKSSIKLMLKDAFSYDKFTNMVAADYVLMGTTTTAFLSVRESPDEAAALADGYYKLITNDLGGDIIATTASAVPNMKIASMLGDYEMVFASGNVVAGVHAAKKREAGEVLAQKLAGSVGGKK
ncbi:MAG: DUF6599 family protein [bacterium]